MNNYRFNFKSHTVTLRCLARGGFLAKELNYFGVALLAHYDCEGVLQIFKAVRARLALLHIQLNYIYEPPLVAQHVDHNLLGVVRTRPCKVALFRLAKHIAKVPLKEC